MPIAHCRPWLGVVWLQVTADEVCHISLYCDDAKARKVPLSGNLLKVHILEDHFWFKICLSKDQYLTDLTALCNSFVAMFTLNAIQLPEIFPGLGHVEERQGRAEIHDAMASESTLQIPCVYVSGSGRPTRPSMASCQFNPCGTQNICRLTTIYIVYPVYHIIICLDRYTFHQLDGKGSDLKSGINRVEVGIRHPFSSYNQLSVGRATGNAGSVEFRLREPLKSVGLAGLGLCIRQPQRTVLCRTLGRSTKRLWQNRLAGSPRAAHRLKFVKTSHKWSHFDLAFSIDLTRTFYSRMRSEGFPFIVGVWGWTCVRVAFVVSSSPRRRVVVVSSLRRRRQLVNFSPLGGTFTATQSLPSKYEKWRKSRTKCSLWRCQVTKCEVVFAFCVTGAILWKRVKASASFFSWQAQHFVMWPFAMSWQAQHFVMCRRCCLHKSQWQGRANVTLLQILWQAQHLVSVLKSDGSFAKVILFELCKNGFIRKTRTKSSLFHLKVWNLREVSHEMLVLTLQTLKVRGHFRVLRGRRNTLEASSMKSCGGLARNARFGSLVLEKLRRPRTKCSFWKLGAWKVAEASHEMLVLEAWTHEKLRKPRTKRSFWKLVAWKVAEALHEILVLEACCLKSRGSLARNARFGSFCSTGVVLCSTE